MPSSVALRLRSRDLRSTYSSVTSWPLMESVVTFSPRLLNSSSTLSNSSEGTERPRSAVLTTLRPKSPSAAVSSVMLAAPSEDCARSDPDRAGVDSPAGSRPVGTPPPPDFVSPLSHAARASTRSTSALAPRDLATVEKRLALMASTSFGRVPTAEHIPATKGPSTAQPTPCTPPAPDRFPVFNAPIRQCGSPAPFAHPLRGAVLHLLAPRAGHGQGGGVRQISSIRDLRPHSPSQAPT